MHLRVAIKAQLHMTVLAEERSAACGALSTVRLGGHATQSRESKNAQKHNGHYSVLTRFGTNAGPPALLLRYSCVTTNLISWAG